MPAPDFDRDGYLGPVRLFSPEECRRIASYLRRDDTPAPAGWSKGRAVHERFLYDLATRPALVGRVAELLGEDVVLWGASHVARRPGQVHPWHSDIESCAPSGGFVSVWVGIENTTRDSALQVISRSHRLRKSVQEARAAVGMPRNGATPVALLALVQQEEPEARLVVPEMGNGEAIFFDGRLWHGTDNRSRSGERLAIILQFAAADREVLIPDFSQLDWPFRFRSEPRPPVILVRGTDRGGPNRLVPPPPPHTGETPMVETAIHAFALPLEDGPPGKPWQTFPAFRGPTRTCADMSCHASVLAGGHQPHPPHSHVEEEILVPLHGEVELTIASSPTDPAPRLERVGPGSFAYYPAWQHHTIRNPGTSPVGYLMFKWRAPLTGAAAPLGVELTRFGDATPPEGASAFWTRKLFEGPTGCLGKVHSHLTVLAPGAGYAAHRDAYDVAIVTLEGTVETLGRRVDPMSVIYYGAGELHGMRNPGDTPARYLVFEFHAPGTASLEPRPLHRRVASALIRGGRRLARPIWDRVKPLVRRPT
ncbi:MAG TPA: cupin domain-containing protein [Gemmatimonadales bacterium]|nr:cupin domain-containing protein [Gemmatimonadales bacterium]